MTPPRSEGSSPRRTDADRLVCLAPAQALDLAERALAEGDTPGPWPWVQAVALHSLGRYGAALRVTSTALATEPAQAGGLDRARLAAVEASVHRQLGRHCSARRLDQRALRAVPSTPAGVRLPQPLADAVVDGQLGLAADCVGLLDVPGARAGLREAEAALAGRASRAGWRPRCRLGWVRAEVALLSGRPPVAVHASEQALRAAERASAPRHAAKSLLFLGVALAAADQQDALGDDAQRPSAIEVLQAALAAAQALGALPLVWPAASVLATRLEETGPPSAHVEGQRRWRTAAAAVRAIAADLPAELRAPWLSRADVTAVTGRACAVDAPRHPTGMASGAKVQPAPAALVQTALTSGAGPADTRAGARAVTSDAAEGLRRWR